MANMTEMVEAVRADNTVGRGTCSPIDECYSDRELKEFLQGCRTTGGAVKRAKQAHSVWADRMADTRNSEW